MRSATRINASHLGLIPVRYLEVGDFIGARQVAEVKPLQHGVVVYFDTPDKTPCYMPQETRALVVRPS